MKKKIMINDKLQKGSYYLTEATGMNFHPDFKPELTPKEMLELGVFGGKYMTDCKDEFPESWFEKAKLSPDKKDISLNYFQVDASMPLSHWEKKVGFILKIQEVGSNGIVDIITVEGYQMKILGKSNDGKPSKDMLARLRKIAYILTYHVERNNVKLCYTGHMIVEKYRKNII